MFCYIKNIFFCIANYYQNNKQKKLYHFQTFVVCLVFFLFLVRCRCAHLYIYIIFQLLFFFLFANNNSLGWFMFAWYLQSLYWNALRMVILHNTQCFEFCFTRNALYWYVFSEPRSQYICCLN